MQSSAPSPVEGSENVVLASPLIESARRMASAAGIPRMVTPRELSDSTKMLLCLGWLGKPIYEGTVPRAEIDRRRARNKRARHARRVHRG